MDEVFGSQTLEALVDRLVPADDYPSAWEAGARDFLRAILATDLQSSGPFIDAGLRLLDREAAACHAGLSFAELPAAAQDNLIRDLLQDTTVLDWGETGASELISLLIRLTIQGFYGNPENGGNRDAVSWRMIGYRILPEGMSFPVIDRAPPAIASLDSVDDEYEIIVVGAGAGGGVAACVLAEAGHRVLLIERGPWLRPGQGWPDHLHNQASFLGYETPAGPPVAGNPRVLHTTAGDLVLAPSDPRWHNVAMTVGGGTRVYGGQAWRFCPEDFRMATTYGVPQGSSLADWPITYEDLVPFYERAEWEIGVCGDSSGDSAAGPRVRPYPMPPLPDNVSSRILKRGARALGLTTEPVPLLINSVPRAGRGACLQCTACGGFGCPGEFKNGTHNTVIPRALATGRCDLLAGVQVGELTTDSASTVTGVTLLTDASGEMRRQTLRAKHVVLAAGAIETARLLLNSRSRREPRGIGNNHDQVGRNLQGHVYSGAIGIFDEVVQDCIGPGPSIATNNFRHHNDGLIGGGMLANDFVHTPIAVWGMLTAPGIIPAWGEASKRGMRDLYTRSALVLGPVQEIPNPESRVTIDAAVRDRFGIPVARLSGSLRPEDLKTAEFLSERAREWLQASGARTVTRFFRAIQEGPSGSQHQAGTCRMGTNPATSVTDAWGRVWGHDNLYIADASLHVTNGGVNPVLTIFANAYRVSEYLAATLSGGGDGRPGYPHTAPSVSGGKWSE